MVRRQATAAIGRRTFLRHIGRTTFGVVVTGTLAACTSADGDEAGSDAAGIGSEAGTTAVAPSAGAVGAQPVDWHRVDLGFVSAYILVRGNEAVVVDTGVAGSERDIGDALTDLGLGWSAVGHVILTHRHPDHVGSAVAVLEQAAGATAYAGREDAEHITTSVPVTVVADGDEVLGLRIITTPGHTPGHIAVLDEVGGLLVAGDALVGDNDGGVDGPDPRFTEDLTVAYESVGKLARLEFGTVVFGHGEPALAGAGAAVAALAEQGPPPQPSASEASPAPRPSAGAS